MSADEVKILVAISDVDAVIKNDSAIDQHARHNTTSVYTAAEIFLLLPEPIHGAWVNRAGMNNRNGSTDV